MRNLTQNMFFAQQFDSIYWYGRKICRLTQESAPTIAVYIGKRLWIVWYSQHLKAYSIKRGSEHGMLYNSICFQKGKETSECKTTPHSLTHPNPVQHLYSSQRKPSTSLSHRQYWRVFAELVGTEDVDRSMGWYGWMSKESVFTQKPKGHSQDYATQMSDCLLRISEVVTVNLGGLKERALTVQASKTDQERAGESLYEWMTILNLYLIIPRRAQSPANHYGNHDGYAVKGTCHFSYLLIWNYKLARLGSIGEIRLMQTYSSSPTMRRYASRYFSVVLEITDAGSSGAGSCLFQPISVR